ncbi:MerR family transcriptional regulator [Flocculibacter collagenilyticus]|uniref:MerR family transcriptional regulator n=1 Tax=Flocculibacter collagenilyticus TaxID=2744479 RepID=UPI0018F79836|nr:MerR family transcriptional regulator [Flocculibacter collagenilyticus]
MRIGELTRKTGMAPATIRFYDAKGWLPKKKSSTRGGNEFKQAALERLQLIKSCQCLGFTQEEIPKLLDKEVKWDHHSIMLRLKEKYTELSETVERLEARKELIADIIETLDENWAKGVHMTSGELEKILSTE